MSEIGTSVEQVQAVLAEAGHEPFEVTRDIIGAHIINAGIEGYSDGEIALAHEPLSGELGQLFGNHFFKDGTVANSLRRGAIANGRTPGPTYEFQRFVAHFMNRALQTNRFTMPQILRSGVQVDGNRLLFDNILVEAERVAANVIDFGPGLAGQSHVEQQIRTAQTGRIPYAYMPISRLPFTNHFLVNRYDFINGRGTANLFMQKGLLVSREDGIAAATDELVTTQTAMTGTAECADVVIASGIYAAPLFELRTSINNAHKVLRSGGTLLIRSVAEASLGETDTDTMVDIAHAAGFNARKTQTYRTSTGGLGAVLFNGGQRRQSMAAVLTK